MTASAEQLVKLAYKSVTDKIPRGSRRLGLKSGQFVCAIGFNPHIESLPDVISVLGFEGYEDLANKRNEIFMNDPYQQLRIEDVLNIYAAVVKQPHMMSIMQYLLSTRLSNIEKRIEATVSSNVIEKYKKEMKAIYNDGVAQIEFAETRLDIADSGFRALVNEVNIIVDSKLIPVGDIFFRNTVLPQEKRKLINRGLIPDELILSRLEDKSISEQERKMLQDVLKRK